MVRGNACETSQEHLQVCSQPVGSASKGACPHFRVRGGRLRADFGPLCKPRYFGANPISAFDNQYAILRDIETTASLISLFQTLEVLILPNIIRRTRHSKNQSRVIVVKGHPVLVRGNPLDRSFSLKRRPLVPAIEPVSYQDCQRARDRRNRATDDRGGHFAHRARLRANRRRGRLAPPLTRRKGPMHRWAL